jgi:NitT/TauT family transport system ATP-binding protein
MSESKRTPLLQARNLRLGHRTGRSREFVVAIDSIDLTIDTGEFISVVGPSGCGKTTFLEAVAGLVPVASGDLLVNGTPIKGPARNRAIVFQSASLFPWRTVEQNVWFGLEVQGRLNDETRQRTQQILRTVGLEKYMKARPDELSGGMRQRVNLARALAVSPDVLLFDEPFGALDAMTRESLQDELLRIWQSDPDGPKTTAVFITHDVTESVLLSDRVIVLSRNPGRIVADIVITAPRPRISSQWRLDPKFTEYCSEILHALHPEQKAAGRSMTAATESSV